MDDAPARPLEAHAIREPPARAEDIVGLPRIVDGNTAYSRPRLSRRFNSFSTASRIRSSRTSSSCSSASRRSSISVEIGKVRRSGHNFFRPMAHIFVCTILTVAGIYRMYEISAM
jgi:hypothetical protein